MKRIKISFLCLLTLGSFSCTKLDESFRSELEQSNSSNITAAQLLVNAYDGLNGPFQTGDLWHINEHTSDELIGPTRGGDWDDNGQWRALHAHTWNADQGQIGGAFNGLLGVQFSASNVLQFSPSPQQAAEARFIRALSMSAVLDGWDQVPYREDLTNYKILPKTLKGKEAADFVIGELNAILPALPDNVASYVANKNAARALLMKLYLNRGVYTNRAAPTFDPADMNLVISLSNQITGFTLTNRFFDNFSPDNDVKSKENIFTLFNIAGGRGGNVRGSAFSTSHYNMNPSGWNGFTTLSDFYDKFETADQRIGQYFIYPGSLPNPGQRVNVGFLIGQQYDLTTGAALNARNPATKPLSFTREVKIREADATTLEYTGIRVIKYPFDYATNGDQKNNDWVVFRYADVLLMRAEAQLRTGNAAGALVIMNDIRTKRGATPLAVANLNNLLDERGRELYWEGWRRQDLIRFGKFLQPWQEKAASNPRNILFPIPSNQLSVNPNLSQNTGY